MGELIVFENLSLDGVMQAPGRPDEDTRDDFPYGGWAVPYAAMQEASDSMETFGALLLGRRTYDDFYGFWPKQPNNPFTDMLTQMQKYVVSATLDEPLAWENSTLIQMDIRQAVQNIKDTSDADVFVMGSGDLIQTLMHHNLVDQVIVLIHPLILGTGHRLFREGTPQVKLELVKTKTTSTGVIVAIYRPLGRDTA